MKHRKILVTLFGFFSQLNGLFDSHYFHAGYLWNEPRLERPLLQTYSVDISGDSTTESRNSAGIRVPLWDLYGPSNLQAFAASIANLNPANPLDELIIEVADLPARPGFGLVSFGGFFKMMRFDFKMYQNLDCGFFAGLEIPVFQFNSAVTSIVDLSPRDNIFPNARTPAWQEFLGSLDGILKQTGLNPQPLDFTATGDSILLLGYSSNYDDHWYLDLCDFTVTLGGLIPTSRQTNPANPFDVPTGYNGFFGLGISFDGAIGLWNWVTLAVHADYLGLLTGNKNIRVKTTLPETGLIKFSQSDARIDPGNVWRFGPYFKADHVLAGLSLLFGYSYERRNDSVINALCPSTSQENLRIANTDPMLDGFTQHNFHLMIEYDASTDELHAGPRVSFFFNHSIFGRRIFITNVKGGYFGVDVTWDW